METQTRLSLCQTPLDFHQTSLNKRNRSVIQMSISKFLAFKTKIYSLLSELFCIK